MINKRAAAAALMILTALLFSACGSRGNPASAAQDGTPSKADQPVSSTDKNPQTSPDDIQAPDEPAQTPTGETQDVPDKVVPPFAFNEYPLPQYFIDFLGPEKTDDYRAVLTALYSGESTVVLSEVSTEQQWDDLRRVTQLAFVPRDLLYDAHYFIGSGPFSFDEESKTLTIRYGWEADEPVIQSRDEYLAAVADFKAHVERIFNDRAIDTSDKEAVAMELYNYVSGALVYVNDMRLSCYDAFTRGEAYCQTYSEMYQYLMWQAGYECGLCSNLDHEWNTIELDGSFYHVDTTWASTGISSYMFYFGMSDAACEKTGHGDPNDYMRSDVLLGGIGRVICADDRYDRRYRPEAACDMTFTCDFSAGEAYEWFNYRYDDLMPWGSTLEAAFEEIPGVTFRWTSEKVEAVTDEETLTLFTGMPVWSVYFADLTGDGIPEICSGVSLGSGIIDERIEVYDYAQKTLYELEARTVYDYRLSLKDGRLYVIQTEYAADKVVSQGRLRFDPAGNTLEIDAAG